MQRRREEHPRRDVSQGCVRPRRTHLPRDTRPARESGREAALARSYDVAFGAGDPPRSRRRRARGGNVGLHGDPDAIDAGGTAAVARARSSVLGQRRLPRPRLRLTRQGRRDGMDRWQARTCGSLYLRHLHDRDRRRRHGAAAAFDRPGRRRARAVRPADAGRAARERGADRSRRRHELEGVAQAATQCGARAVRGRNGTHTHVPPDDQRRPRRCAVDVPRSPLDRVAGRVGTSEREAGRRDAARGLRSHRREIPRGAVALGRSPDVDGPSPRRLRNGGLARVRRRRPSGSRLRGT